MLSNHIRPVIAVGYYPAFMESDDPLRQEFATRMRLAREAADLTQLQVAERFGLNKGTVSAWEQGRGVPDAMRLREVARLYKCSADDLLTGRAPLTWPFSEPLHSEVLKLRPEDMAALENVMRAHLRIGEQPQAGPSRFEQAANVRVQRQRKPDRKSA